MEEYNTPMLDQVAAGRGVKPGVAVPVVAIYVGAVTTFVAAVQGVVYAAVIAVSEVWVK